jgi:hypothetical protein
LAEFMASSHPWRWSGPGSITVDSLSKALIRIRVSRRQQARVLAELL